MNFDVLKDLIKNKKLADAKKILIEMNEYDIASLIEDLPIEDLIKVYRLLPKDIATDVFVNLEDTVQQELIGELTKKETKTLIEDMFTDDIVDLFEEMPAIMVTNLLGNLDKETRNTINVLLKYPENSAGSLMATEYIHLKKGLTIQESIDRIKKQKDDFVSYDSCFVTDKERKLLGTVTIKDLLINDMDTMIDDIMVECEHSINTMMDQEDVADVFQDYNYSSLPVVDSENRLVGIITIDDIVDIMEEEATEDMEKMAAIVPTEKPYLKLNLWDIYKSRMPWLLFLMISATFTGAIISSFEGALAKVAVLTVFIPMIMGTGGNAGGQASVTIIRALSLGEVEFKDAIKVIFKECIVGIICGLTLSVCNFFKLLLFDQVGWLIALVVCLALFLTVLLAKIIGALLPILADKVHLDPAVMANPIITTIVDAGSLLVYFKVATMLLGI